MLPPAFVLSDFVSAFMRLFPRGPIWPRESDAVEVQTFAGLVPNTLAQYQRATNLLTDCFPGTTIELLPEWEETLGLPDVCSATLPSLQQRVAAVVAKLIATGGQSIPYFIALANALGFEVSVTEFWPLEADDECDQPCYGEAWAFAWEINAPSVTISYAAADQSLADDPLETWDSGELVCRIARLSPAHTILFFGFTDSIDGIPLNLPIPAAAVGEAGAASFVPGPQGEQGEQGIRGPVGPTPVLPVDFYGFYLGSPAAGVPIMSFVAARAVTFSANLAGSGVRVLVAAKSQVVLTLNQNGNAVGTATIAAGGTSAVLASNGFTLAPGDAVQWVAPTSPDATAAHFQITMTGTR